LAESDAARQGIFSRRIAGLGEPTIGLGRWVARVGASRLSKSHFPPKIRSLPAFEGPFDATRLAAEGCEILFASYPAGTTIEPHTHPTENCGVITRGELILIMNGEEARYRIGEWYLLAPGEKHAARFEVETSEIEFWFSV
jgi:quercetin dioxygenase-like cupin family protein